MPQDATGLERALLSVRRGLAEMQPNALARKGSFVTRLKHYLGRNAIAFAALFIALGGTATAASYITSQDIVDNSITGADIKRGSVRGSDLRDNSVTGADIRAGAVNSDDIADGSITAADLHDGVLANA